MSIGGRWDKADVADEGVLESHGSDVIRVD